MATIWDQAKSIVPGIQQIFQNAGYNQQQGNRSVVSGLIPRALGGTGLVAPARASGSTSYSTPPSQPTQNTRTTTSGGSTGGSTGISTPQASSFVPNVDNYANQANQSNQDLRQMELDAINAEYEQEANRLSGLESSVRSQYGTVKSQAEQYFPQFQALTEQQKAGDLGSLQETENVRKSESKSAMNKARALLSELQRRQMAYMSATGNYSSSTADAFGEQFGRQAFSQLSDIQGQRDVALRQIEQERGKVNTFYNEKILTAKQSYDKQLNDLNSQFMGQLDQINSARGAAASAKRQATIDTWRNYTNAKLQLDNQLFQYKTQYDQWKAEMDQNLRSQAQVGAISSVNPNFAGTESAVSGVGTTPTTQTGPLSMARTLSDEDKLKLMQRGSLPFASAQSTGGLR